MAEETKITTVTEGSQEAEGQEAPQQQDGILEKIRGLLGGGKKEEPASEPEKPSEGQEEKKETETGKEKETKIEKTYTQADLDAAVKKALEQEDVQRKEKERLEKLTPEQRAVEEQESMKKKNAELTAKIQRMELEQKAAVKLSEKKLPAGLADFLDYTDETRMEASLEKIGVLYQEQLEAGIKERLKGSTPKGLGGAGSLTDSMISSEIAKRIRGGF